MGLVGALKDKAAFSRAALLRPSADTSAPTAPHLAVLRATTHHPASTPPHPRHIAALLAYGHGSRLSAAALVDALTTRLASTRDPGVALKSLLAVHHLLSRGAFILRDQLVAALQPNSGRRSPLNLSSFRHGSFALSSWVRFHARLLELLLAVNLDHKDADEERVSSLLDGDLIRETDALVGVVEEIARAPAVEGNGVVAEAVRLVEDDRVAVEREIVVRVREVGERLGSFRFGESVEVVCLLRRLEGCMDRPVGGTWRARDEKWFWSEVSEVMTRVKDVVVREERGGRVAKDRVSDSARFVNRAPLVLVDPVQFVSSRWTGVAR